MDYHSYYICTNDQDNVAYWEVSQRIEVLANNFGLSQIQLGILVLVTTPGKFCNFSPLLNLERDRELFKYEHLFFLKNFNFIINWVPSLFTSIVCLKDYHSQSNKMKPLGLQKSQFLNSLVNWEKSGSAT